MSINLLIPMDIRYYRNYIANMKTIEFKWENLPKGLSEFNLEKKLLFNNSICIFPKNGSWFAETYVRERFDIYDNPVNGYIVSISQKLQGTKLPKMYHNYIYNSSSRQTEIQKVDQLLKELVKLDKRIMENIDMNRLQLFIHSKDKKSHKIGKSIEQIIKNGGSVISLGENIDKDNITALSELVADNSLNLWENWFNKWTMVTKILGISINETNYKKANVNTGELGVSAEVVNRVVNDSLLQRRDFIRRASEAYPEWEKVTVSIRELESNEPEMEQENDTINKGKENE